MFYENNNLRVAYPLKDVTLFKNKFPMNESDNLYLLLESETSPLRMYVVNSHYTHVLYSDVTRA